VHAAPPVRVSLARSPGWIVFNALCAGAATANLAAWAAMSVEAAAPAGVALACAIVAAVAASLLAWRSQRPGDLVWDGAAWQWQGVEGWARVAIDLDGWMLLRFEATAATRRRRWIAASRPRSLGPWAALRAALYSPRPAAAVDAPPAP
jgi:hypothetical protein